MKTLKIVLTLVGTLFLVGCTSTSSDVDIIDSTVLPTTQTSIANLDYETELYGSAAALESTSFTIEEMLIYALQDEYAARAEYDYILMTFDVDKPFSNIIDSEETHISFLLPLFEAYGIEVIDDTSNEHVISITSLEEAYATGVQAEINNISMYNIFLSQDNLPADLIDAFTKLRDASENHLAAFQRNLDRYE